MVSVDGDSAFLHTVKGAFSDALEYYLAEYSIENNELKATTILDPSYKRLKFLEEDTVAMKNYKDIAIRKIDEVII